MDLGTAMMNVSTLLRFSIGRFSSSTARGAVSSRSPVMINDTLAEVPNK